MADEVLRERRGHVDILTINRPEARNAINGAVSAAMAGFMEELATDPECWVVVITGSGDKAFSAGMDLKAFSSGEGGAIMSASGGFAGLTQRDFPKPIIAAVNGSCLAGGFEIMLSCDLVVAANHATFGIPEAKRGLVAGAGGLIRMPKRLPLAVALELAMTGDPIDAQRAHALGLVNRVVPGPSLLGDALDLAQRIAERPARRPVVQERHEAGRRGPRERGVGHQRRGRARGVLLADAMEGPIAFAEKRPPTGRASGDRPPGHRHRSRPDARSRPTLPARPGRSGLGGRAVVMTGLVGPARELGGDAPSDWLEPSP